MLVKNGKLVLEDGVYEGDILIEDGKISSIGRDIPSGGLETIDAEGSYVLPGGVDVHTHFNIDVGIARSVDDFYNGSKAALLGGTTTIVDHMGFGPKGGSLQERVDTYHGYASGKSLVDYGFHGVIARVDQDVLGEMASLVDQGITSFKAYMTYDDRLADYDLYRLLRRAKELGAIVPVHAENHSLINGYRKQALDQGRTRPLDHSRTRPNLTEAEAVGRVLKIARLAGDAPIYIVHLSTREGLEEVRRAREAGQKNIYVETCPQYLLLDESRYLEEGLRGLRYIMSPPLRGQEDREALWQGLGSGLVDIIATDHCAFNMDQKALGAEDFTKCPNGGPGVEERLLTVFSEGVLASRISLEDFVRLVSTNPAKAYGLYPKKGVLREGSDGDLVIIDPGLDHVYRDDNIQSRSNYTIFEGLKLRAKIQKVVLRGNLVVDGGEIIREDIRGEFIKRL